tara:strand:+ start:265 stop:549 length:285 start_codon:yes stop_codon:yes gene_type:complete
MNIKLIFLFFTFITLSNAQEKVRSQEKESKFLELTVDNPELQIEIDTLKKQYDADLIELKTKHKEQKIILRKSYKERFKELRKRFKLKKKNKKK